MEGGGDDNTRFGPLCFQDGDYVSHNFLKDIRRSRDDFSTEVEHAIALERQSRCPLELFESDQTVAKQVENKDGSSLADLLFTSPAILATFSAVAVQPGTVMLLNVISGSTISKALTPCHKAIN